jgi:hypothetical protein
MNIRLTKLLKRHQYSLEQKGIDSPVSLLPAIRLDMVKAYYVLAEIYNRTTAGVIEEFFADQPDPNALGPRELF